MSVDPAREVARPPLALAVAVAASSVVAAVGMCTIVGGFPSSASVGPVLAAAVVGALVPLVLLRTRLPPALAAVVGAAAVLLTALSATLPGSTWATLPTGTTFRLLHQDAAASSASLRAPGYPIHAVPGVVLLAATAIGMLSMLGQVLLLAWGDGNRSNRRLIAVLPSLGVVVMATSVSSPAMATGLTVGLLLATGAAVVATDRSTEVGASGSGVGGGGGAGGRRGAGAGRWAGGRRTARADTAALVVGVVTLGAVVVTGLGVGVGTQASSAPASGGSRPSELNLLASVVPLERRNPATVVFTARSPVATYWAIGALTTYAHGTWVPSAALSAAAAGTATPATGLPAVPTAVAARFRAEVTMGSLGGRLLPLPPDTTAVSAPFPVVRTPGAAIAGQALVSGDGFTADALVPRLSGSSTGPGSSQLTGTQLAADTALPPLPAAVHSLAATVTARAGNPMAEAALLENWFRSGSFHYSLEAPPAPAGTDPLVEFLTVVRTGTCEQFAGAFAVLARSIGLPARVMVGFTSGLRSSDGSSLVRGIDAHAWPEVYVGGTRGWVSFEPTPSLPAGEAVPSDVIGPSLISSPPPTIPTTAPASTVPASTVAPTTVPQTTVPTSPTTTPTTPSTSVPTNPTTTLAGEGSLAPPSGTGHGLPEILLVIGVVVLLTGIGAFLIWWRRRSASDRRSTVEVPDGPMAEPWMRIERALAQADLGRPSSRSPTAHARVLRTMTRSASSTGGAGATQMEALAAALDDIDMVGDLVERSVFGAEFIDATTVADAEAASRRVQHGLRRPGRIPVH